MIGRSIMQLCRIIPASLLLFSLGACTEQTTQPAAAHLGLGLADTALSGGAPRLALQVSRAVLAHDPHDVPALLRLGDAYYQLADYAHSAAAYREVNVQTPGNTAAIMGLGRVALATDPAEAGARFSEILALDPQNQDALSNRGIAEDLTGMHAEAQADYRRAITLGEATPDLSAEDDTQAHALAATRVDLAVSLAISGYADEAVRILRPILSAPDTTPRVRQDFAMTLTLDNRGDEAASVLTADMNQAQARSAMSSYEALRVGPRPVASKSSNSDSVKPGADGT